MLTNLVNATYIAAGLMFILALAGLSKHETAKKGNAFGILGMVLALVATNYAIAQPVDGGASTGHPLPCCTERSPSARSSAHGRPAGWR